MRKLLTALAAGGTILGGAMIAQGVSAQPYVVYPAAPAYHYDAYGRAYDDDYLAPGAMPYDRFGPDPNGMIAADGHRIKCKLEDTYSYRFDRYMTRRVCD
jgi:hypothetical protein